MTGLGLTIRSDFGRFCSANALNPPKGALGGFRSVNGDLADPDLLLVVPPPNKVLELLIAFSFFGRRDDIGVVSPKTIRAL